MPVRLNVLRGEAEQYAEQFVRCDNERTLGASRLHARNGNRRSPLTAIANQTSECRYDGFWWMTSWRRWFVLFAH